MTAPQMIGPVGIKDGRGWGPYRQGYVYSATNPQVHFPLGPDGQILGLEYDFQPGADRTYMSPPKTLVGFDASVLADYFDELNGNYHGVEYGPNGLYRVPGWPAGAVTPSQRYADPKQTGRIGVPAHAVSGDSENFIPFQPQTPLGTFRATAGAIADDLLIRTYDQDPLLHDDPDRDNTAFVFVALDKDMKLIGQPIGAAFGQGGALVPVLSKEAVPAYYKVILRRFRTAPNDSKASNWRSFFWRWKVLAERSRGVDTTASTAVSGLVGAARTMEFAPMRAFDPNGMAFPEEIEAARAMVGDTPPTPQPRFAALRRALKAVFHFRDRVKAPWYVYAETDRGVSTTAHENQADAFECLHDREVIPGENYTAAFAVDDPSWPDPVHDRYRPASSSEAAVAGAQVNPIQPTQLQGRFRVVVRDQASWGAGHQDAIIPIFATDNLAQAHESVHTLERENPGAGSSVSIFDTKTGHIIASVGLPRSPQPVDPYAGPAAPVVPRPQPPTPPPLSPSEPGPSPARYQTALNAATDTAFWNETKYKPNQHLSPKDPADVKMIPKWLAIRERIQHSVTPQRLHRSYAGGRVFDAYLAKPSPFFVYSDDAAGDLVLPFMTLQQADQAFRARWGDASYVALFKADGPNWPVPEYDVYPGGEIEIDRPPQNVSGDPMSNSPNPWLPILRNAPLSVGGERYGVPLVGALAPVLAPATGGITAKISLDGNQILHAAVCVDGKCYRGSVDLKEPIAAVMTKIAAYHQQIHAAGLPAGTSAQGVPAVVGRHHGGGGGHRGGNWGGRRSRWGRNRWGGGGYSYYVDPSWWPGYYGQPVDEEIVEEVDESGQSQGDPSRGDPGQTGSNDAVTSGDIMLGQVDRAVRAAGVALVGQLVDHHVQVACGGWWDDVTGAVKKAASGVEHAVTGTIRKLKEPIAKAATAAISAIPGVGPLVAPYAEKLTNALVDAAAGSATAQNVIAQAQKLAQSNPTVKKALDVAHQATAQVVAKAHLAETASKATAGDPAAVAQVQQAQQAAQSGDPAAQEAMSFMDQAIAEFNAAIGAAGGDPAAVQGWTDLIPGYGAIDAALHGGHHAHRHARHRHHHHRHHVSGDVVTVPMKLWVAANAWSQEQGHQHGAIIATYYLTPDAHAGHQRQQIYLQGDPNLGLALGHLGAVAGQIERGSVDEMTQDLGMIIVYENQNGTLVERARWSPPGVVVGTGGPVFRQIPQVGHWMIPLALGLGAGAGGMYGWEHRDYLKKWLLGA